MDPSDPNFWPAVTAGATVVYTLATIALVMVTIANVKLVGKYTETTERTVAEMQATRRAQVEAVEEMRRAREAEIQPVLVPYVRATDLLAGQLKWGVRNVGRGPALRIDVRVRLGRKWDWQLQASALMPGEVRFVRRAGDFGDNVTYSDLQKHPLQLTGSYFDSAGTEIRAEGAVPFGDGWTPLQHEVFRAIVERDVIPHIDPAPPG
ncbi:MAG: hypothetical protein AAB011_10695 [Candidatus Eisenbacteria bacterium]